MLPGQCRGSAETICRSGHIVQDRPLRSAYWADIPELSARDRRCPAACVSDLGEILRHYERFWGDRTLPRYLHHPMFVYEFGDTAFVARQADGQIVGYLLGFVAPTGDGYIHFVAVRDDARGRGLARQLYEVFAAAAAKRGATALKAITGPQNEGSILLHRKLGFEMTISMTMAVLAVPASSCADR